MVKNAALGKEIVIAVENKIGTLANISKVLADHDINLEGVAGYAMSPKEARVMIVVDDTLRAIEALGKAGYAKAKENEVVVLDLVNKAGALKTVSARLAAEGIDIRYLYGTICAGSCPARLIIATDHNERAVVALKK